MQKKLRPFGVLNYEILNKKEAATGWCPKFMKYQRLKKKTNVWCPKFEKFRVLKKSQSFGVLNKFIKVYKYVQLGVLGQYYSNQSFK